MAFLKALGLSKTEPPFLDMIEHNLYLSGVSKVANIKALKHHNITHILTINDVPLPWHIKRSCPHVTIKFIMAVDMPHTDLLSYFDECYEFITNALNQGAVVVHCMMGMSRSATIVIAYLMKKYKMSYKEASAMVKAKRAVCPNSGFVKQLQNYEELVFNT